MLEEGLLRPKGGSGAGQGASPQQGQFQCFAGRDELPALVIEAHRQVAELHGKSEEDIPAPDAAAYRDWKAAPYGGGANFWNLQVDSETVAARMIRPFKRFELYVCGEAFAGFSGLGRGRPRHGREGG